jgi:hypothetical protein
VSVFIHLSTLPDAVCRQELKTFFFFFFFCEGEKEREREEESSNFHFGGKDLLPPPLSTHFISAPFFLGIFIPKKGFKRAPSLRREI